METLSFQEPQVIDLRPATIFAFIKVFPLILCSIGFLLLAARYWPLLLKFSFVFITIAGYRFIYIRNIRYTINPETLRLSHGIFLNG